ncbi:MAG: DNA cytosine methyltransferase [Nitrososphaerota archaeon]|nr:DNA cytosine methyltransferase [Nitrososphaerota archaeon]
MNVPLVSLYTGAGGLDYGFEAVGFDFRLGIDFDQDSCETVKQNRDWNMIPEKIQGVTSSRILLESRVKKNDISLLIGGPPCEPFSKSSYWMNGDSRRLQDPRAATLFEFMRCIDDLLPEAFLLENVYGIKYSGKEEGFQLLQKLTAKVNEKNHTGYRLYWGVLNAADFGVPQLRRRFFMVAHREGKAFDFPPPTHLSDGENAAGLPSHTTAWDAIGGSEALPGEDLSVKGQWADLLPSIPEGWVHAMTDSVETYFHDLVRIRSKADCRCERVPGVKGELDRVLSGWDLGPAGGTDKERKVPLGRHTVVTEFAVPGI